MQGKVARRLSKIESLSRDDAAAGRLEANPKGRLSLRLMRRCSSSETLFIESPRRRALPEPQIQAAQTLRIEWERSKLFERLHQHQRHLPIIGDISRLPVKRPAPHRFSRPSQRFVLLIQLRNLFLVHELA